MFLERGFVFTHEAVRDWEKRFAPLVSDQLRTKRRGQAGKSWYVDETYLKVVRRFGIRGDSVQRTERLRANNL
jgi:transposase-like protein